jgi:hypothetical protein
VSVSLQRLWHRIPYLPLSGFLRGREPIPEPPEALEKVAVTFNECEDDCEPTAEQIEAEERERAEQFKRDQLLPIIGMAGPPY